MKAVNISPGRVFGQECDAAREAAAQQRDASLRNGPLLGPENK